MPLWFCTALHQGIPDGLQDLLPQILHLECGPLNHQHNYLLEMLNKSKFPLDTNKEDTQCQRVLWPPKSLAHTVSNVHQERREYILCELQKHPHCSRNNSWEEAFDRQSSNGAFFCVCLCTWFFQRVPLYPLSPTQPRAWQLSH